jgi:Rad3-related DNA helicase
MTYKNKDTSWPKMARKIADIVERYPDDPILIHTVSYAFTQFLQQRMRANGRIITYRTSRDRIGALTRFKKSGNGILLAPSFERGIDLPYDECRVVIIPKIPYPALKDKQVNARLYQPGGKGWYILETARSLIQMCGRAMRFDDDACEIYLLDTQFTEQIWKRYRHMLPGWWKAAVRMEGSQGGRSASVL